MTDPVIEALRKHAEYCECEAEKAKRSILHIDEGVALALVCIAARLRTDIREREKAAEGICPKCKGSGDRYQAVGECFDCEGTGVKP